MKILRHTIFFFVLFSFMGLKSQSNQELIIRLIRENLMPYSFVSVTEDNTGEWNDLQMFLSEKTKDNAPAVKIKNLKIRILYKRIAKPPFLKSQIVRIIRINFWAYIQHYWKFHDISYQDYLDGPFLDKFENPNLMWTRGHFETDEAIEPSWIPAFLLISTSVIVIFTFFYVRS